MPKDVSYGGSKPEKDSLAQAKGKNGKSLSNEIFAQVENFFYEFGLISKPSSNKRKENDYQQKQNDPSEDDPDYYSEDEVLLDQHSYTAQDNWHKVPLEKEQDNRENSDSPS